MPKAVFIDKEAIKRKVLDLAVDERMPSIRMWDKNRGDLPAYVTISRHRNR